MDQKQQRVNEAAEKFAEALRESYQTVAGPLVTAQELNARLMQEFFDGVINNLRKQAESNRALAEDFIERQQEASQALTQEALEAYQQFLASMFAYYRGAFMGLEAGGSNAEERTDPQDDQISEHTVWKGTGQGAREEYLRLLERTGEIKPGSGELPADFWDLPRPEDPEGLVRRAVQEDRR